MKTIRSAQFEIIDIQLLQFVQFCRQAHKPVTLTTLSVRELIIRDKLLKTDSNDHIKIELETFSASKNYCAFMWRHALRSQSLYGEAGRANVISVAKEISHLLAKLLEYSVDHTYNMNETRLFYKLIPHRTYGHKSEVRRIVRGIKGRKANDGIKEFLRTNVDSSHKVPRSIIGKALKPRCFLWGSQMSFTSAR